MVDKLHLIGRLITSIIGMIIIGILEYTALKVGIDSYMLGLSFALIGGLAGYNIKKIKDLFIR